MGGGTFRLYLITDRSAFPGRTLDQTLGAALSQTRPGEVAVQLREKDMPPRDLLPLAERLAEIVHMHGGWLLVNDRADIALACGADGVHLTGVSMPVDAVKRAFPGSLIGVSTHSAADASSAAGADFIVTGPVHQTASKPGTVPVGVEGLAKVCAAVSIPVYALGGIDEQNAASAVRAGACGVACISAVMASPDPGGAVRRILDAVKSGALLR
jgi:thiamine-phosphate pyrophosphorylase